MSVLTQEEIKEALEWAAEGAAEMEDEGLLEVFQFLLDSIPQFLCDREGCSRVVKDGAYEEERDA